MIIGNEGGLTLIELLIGAMIVAILGVVAIPQFTSLLDGFKLNGASQVVWGDIHKARMIAIKENRTIRIDFMSTSYNVIRVDTSEVVARRNLAASYAGVTVSTQNNTISFGSMGTAGGGSKTVEVGNSSGMKSFTILTTGRIGKIS